MQTAQAIAMTVQEKPCVRAAALILPGEMPEDEAEALVSALTAAGIKTTVLATDTHAKPSANAVLERAVSAPGAMDEHGAKRPVFLLGHGFDAALAVALLRTMPNRFAGAMLARADYMPPLQRAVYHWLLRWERFRLGSDVPSRILHEAGKTPPTVGQAIIRIGLNHLLAPERLKQLSRHVDILVIPFPEARHPLFRKGFLNPEPSTCTEKRVHFLSNLNQDLKNIFPAWIEDALDGAAERNTLA